MVTRIPSRSQRRMERRQAMLLLTLVLAVSLVSFALGVMVGRGRGQLAAAAIPAVERRPVTLPGPAAALPAGGPAQDLTFYDALPKGGKPPLGSGINLPPETTPSAPSAPPPAQVAQPASPPAPSPQLPPSGPSRGVQPPPSSPGAAPPPAASAPPRTPSPPPAARNVPAKAGSWIIQAGSFPDAAAAGKMKQRLAGKGFPVYIQEANLGAKGTWYRVIVGPFDNESAASGAAGRLQGEEQLSVMVRKS